MALIHALKKEWAKKQSRNWDKMYIAVDLHETVMMPSYRANEVEASIYTEAINCLQHLSNRSDIILIMWTSSTQASINGYMETLESKYGIKFDYVNENPLEVSNEVSNFSQKFYFNLVFDDKAGFYPNEDWYIVHDFFLNHH